MSPTFWTRGLEGTRGLAGPTEQPLSMYVCNKYFKLQYYNYTHVCLLLYSD